MNFIEWLRGQPPLDDALLDTRVADLAVQCGEPEQTWCDNCMTSNGIRAPIYLVTPSGVSQAGHVQWCQRCYPYGPWSISG